MVAPSNTIIRESNWQCYAQLLISYNIPEKECRYYVKHIEDLIKHFSKRSLGSLNSDEITDYLQAKGYEQYQDWQFQ